MPGLDATALAAVNPTDGAVTIENYDNVHVFDGIDDGQGEHHGVALARKGNVLFDKPLPNDEAEMRDVLQHLKRLGTVLVILDQPATIGALPIAVPMPRACSSGTSPASRCGASQTSTQGKPRPMHETPRSSPKPPEPFPTCYDPSKWQTNQSPSSRCCVGLIMTSWVKSRPPATGCAGFSHRPTPHRNE